MKRAYTGGHRRRHPYGRAIWSCLLLVIVLAAGLLFYKHYTKMRKIEQQSIAWEDSSRWQVQYGDSYSEEIVACMMEDSLYVSASFINETYGDWALFLDESHGKIYYTTASRKTVYTVDSSTVSVQGDEQQSDIVFRTYNDTWLVKLDWAKEQFGIDYALNEEQDILTLYPNERQNARIDGGGETVYLKQSPQEGRIIDAIRGNTTGYSYYRIVEDGETVTLAGENDGYALIVTSDGQMGYVKKEYLTEMTTVLTTKPEQETIMIPETRQLKEKVVLAWHQNYSGTFSEEMAALFDDAKGIVNVISPTWYKFSEEGELLSAANQEYVDWAHDQGYQIWALFDNDFDDSHTYSVIQDEEKRTALITALLRQCQELQLDGINVDFESLSEDTAPYFIEFIRELAAVLRPAGYYVSVDVTVPQGWSSYYRRDLLAACCDYVIVMGYDEHYSGGGVAGSVGSMTFIEEAVAALLEQMQSDKLALAVPFYTRLWSTSEGVVTDQALGMKEAEDLLADKQVQTSYDEETGQDYATYEEDGLLYEIWMENEASMEKRLRVASDNSLAGVACWKIGLEKDEIWPYFRQYKEGVL